MTTDTITNEQLKDISAKLKTYYSNWASLIAEAISKDKDWKNWTNNHCTEQNARNISTGVIVGQRHRRIFMRVSAKLIQEAVQENLDIKQSVESVIDNK